MSGVNRTEVFVQFFVHVRRSQRAQSLMYMGYSEHGCLCTQVAVGTVTYVRGLQWAQSCMYVGCSKVN
jgi:hypothetical protein